MQEEVLNPNAAWRAYRLLRSDRRIGYFGEPPELPEVWHTFMPNQINSPNLWTDAYLCAYCHAARLTLVTFDSRIPAREGLEFIRLGGSAKK